MATTRSVTLGQRPESDAGYLELLTKIIFMGGLNRNVVESKWEGFLDAFEKFEPERVAGFGEEEVERLAENDSIIRYAAKIQAVVDNAGVMVELAAESGSFGNWLRQTLAAEGWQGTAKELGRMFRYVSEASAKNFLYAVGEDVGQVPAEMRRKYGAA